MRIIGIDPGIAITGWGIVEEREQTVTMIAYGVVTTAAKTPLPNRLQIIYQELTQIIAEWHPDSSAIEELFFSKNAKTALSVGHGRGVSMLALANANLPITEYKPLEIKQAITGHGGASKPQIQQMVKLLLELDEIPRPDDAADALAVAICHLHSARLRSLI
ncbi:crossover junction endodeoxyribonuclease RuvC [Anaerolineales bacterium HSG24]|nr:crossover junction endodeoxyribonuclease RuvC [Anaerolineales bacterium HSG24]